ncbi:hypothetical protein FNH09_37540 [Streptomyces adustus]|uniref:Uncharacterized protein n=1 Tax=Streptomyces adustus TaxID=1609272 RepID=A0A5N8VN69_9ACTN|nr:hypothetical protein [Streptomyces adustus]MPY36721.1 hypothetical protein [Streptomyces adustus]
MTTTATPTARKRCRKTRTKKVNPRPPILASTLAATEIDLAPGREHMVCPDCRTWCPITGMNGTPKLVPHHTDPAGTPNTRRCTAGSDRRVTIDVTVGSWSTTLIEARPTIDSRRPTKVLPKPAPAPARAVAHIAARRQPVGRGPWILREMAWASAALEADRTDARRAQLPVGEVPTDAPAVPLTTLHPKHPMH